MRRLLGVCMAASACLSYAQGSPLTPMITLASTPLVINQPVSIRVLVSNPNYSPVPTGAVTVDFGDGSAPEPLTLSETSANTTHVYSTAGQFIITASYSGDANFGPATKSLTAASISSSPTYLLRLFGDSFTSLLPGSWPQLVTSAEGWTRTAFSCGGCRTNDMAPAIYNSVVDTTFSSTWLLGQNDGASPQFTHAALAENAWLAIPEGPAKLRAQSSNVTQSGSWFPSNLYPTTGLWSTGAGSALTASIPGNAIYVGLSSITTNDYTIDILIDGIDMGSVSPVADYPGRYYAAEPYGLRYAIGGSPDAAHVVQVICQNPGTSGCYVDWIGGNGGATRPNLAPYVWTGVSYTTLQPDPKGTFPYKQQAIRTIEGQLASDGLAIREADIAAVFNGPALPECVGDGVHPNACGNQIEATAFLSAMTFLATEAQRIDIGHIKPVIVGTPAVLDEATATSGLPVSYRMISGSASISGSQITATAPGNLTVLADQSGNSMFLPVLPVQFSVLAILPTMTSLSGSSNHPNPSSGITLTASITSNGNIVPIGSVDFYDRGILLGSGTVNRSGIAVFATPALIPSTKHIITASYVQNSQYAASTSSAIECSACAAILFAKEQ